MRELAGDVVLALNWTVLGYVVVLDLTMLLLVLAGARRVVASRRWQGAEGHDEIFASPLTPAASVLVPAHDEEESASASCHAFHCWWVKPAAVRRSKSPFNQKRPPGWPTDGPASRCAHRAAFWPCRRPSRPV